MVVKVEPGIYAATNNLQSQSQPQAASAGCKASAEPAVPSPTTKAALPFREYCGNSKRITVESNCAHLRIVGNGNRIFVHRNCGQLEVLGNGNRLRVLDNRSGGRISYTGNGGRVYLCGDADGQTVSGGAKAAAGSEVPEPIVRYTGVNGSVRLVARAELLKALAQPDNGRTEAVVAAARSSARRAGEVRAKSAVPRADDESRRVDDELRSSSAAAPAAMECGSARSSRVTGAPSATVIGASGEQQPKQQQQRQQQQQQQHATSANRICVANLTISLENLGTISTILRHQRQQMSAGDGSVGSGSDLVLNDMR